MNASTTQELIKQLCLLATYLPPNDGVGRSVLEAVHIRACQEPMGRNRIIAYLKFGRQQPFHPNKDEAYPEAWLIEARCRVMRLDYAKAWNSTPAGTEL